jgi:ribosomal protein S18 acetylase RimI-like enzyme
VKDTPLPESAVEIVEFQRRYARYFRDLNYEWLEKYFEVEPYDKIVLNDPQKQIIKLGGCVFFARVSGEIVGTCALLKHTERKYELAKMGITERFRGRGIGRRLTQAAIDKARALEADTLVLATSKLLPVANHLYESMGFQHADLSIIGPLPYKRETIVMAMKM